MLGVQQVRRPSLTFRVRAIILHTPFPGCGPADRPVFGLLPSQPAELLARWTMRRTSASDVGVWPVVREPDSENLDILVKVC